MFKQFKWFGAGAMAACVAVAGASLWLQADRRRSDELRQENERLAAERAELARVVERLNVERRVAQVDVLEQHTAFDGRVLQTVIRLREFGREGQPLPAQVFGVPGDVPHFDALVVKFENDSVARGDQLRGSSLSLFRRVYGETQSPENGYWLGRRGAVPDVYRVNPHPSAFERELWREFWSYATDPAKAREAGVRVAQGEAVYAPMKTGERWLLTLESDGGLNLHKQADASAWVPDEWHTGAVSQKDAAHPLPPAPHPSPR